MKHTPEETLNDLIDFLAEKAAEEYLENLNHYLEGEIPPLPEELYDHPKPIGRLSDGRIRIRIR
jgi:hypothetical protein